MSPTIALIEHHDVPGLGRVHLCQVHARQVQAIRCGCQPGAPDGCAAIVVAPRDCSPPEDCDACDHRREEGCNCLEAES